MLSSSVVAAVVRVQPRDFRIIKQEWAAVRIQSAFRAFLVGLSAAAASVRVARFPGKNAHLFSPLTVSCRWMREGSEGVEGTAGHCAAAGIGARPSRAQATLRDAQVHERARQGPGARAGTPLLDLYGGPPLKDILDDRSDLADPVKEAEV
jgi:hypothetical protein